jgi:integrase
LDAERRPICRACSGIVVDLDCRRCGAEEWLYGAGTCWRCALADRVDRALAGRDGQIPEALQPLAEALKRMPRPNSGVTWLHRTDVRNVLERLATGELPLTHEALDAVAVAPSRRVEYIRGLLVEHGVLPARDPLLGTYRRWLEAKLSRIDDADQRRVIELFGRWHHLRNLENQAKDGGVRPNTFLWAKQTTTLAIGFLAWLENRGRTLAECSQHDVDAWFAGGPSSRGHVVAFLYWAINTRRLRRLHIPGREHRSHPAIGPNERISALAKLLVDDVVPLPWRIAGSFVLLYGQPAERITRLRLDHVALAPQQVRIRPSNDWVDVPEPLATLLRSYVAARQNMQTAANAGSTWLFPGTMPGRPVTVNHLVKELRAVGVPVRAARTGTWRDLVRQAPPNILAEALGISPRTAMQHAERAGSDWLRYVALERHDASAGNPARAP